MFELGCGHSVDDSTLEICQTNSRGEVLCPTCLRAAMTLEERSRLRNKCLICYSLARRSDDVNYVVLPCSHVICRGCIWEFASGCVPTSEYSTCPKCNSENHIKKTSCRTCHAPLDPNRLFYCPLCMKPIGFPWLQNSQNIRWNAPHVYEKMGPYLRFVVTTAYFMPMISTILKDTWAIIKVFLLIISAFICVIILSLFFGGFIAHTIK